MQKATDDCYFINLAVPPTVNHLSVLTSIMEKNKKRLQTQLIVVAYTDKGIRFSRLSNIPVLNIS